jgi:hypothetical protein
MNKAVLFSSLLGWSLFTAAAGCAHFGNGTARNVTLLDSETISHSPDGKWSVTKATRGQYDGDDASSYWIAERRSGRGAALIVAVNERGWPRIDEARWSPDGSLLASVIRHDPSSENLAVFRRDGQRWKELSMQDFNWLYHFQNPKGLLGNSKRELRGEWVRELKWTGPKSFRVDHRFAFGDEPLIVHCRTTYTVGHSRAVAGTLSEWVEDRSARN